MQVLIKENLLWQLTIVCVLNLLKCCRDEIVEMLRWLMCQWYFPCLWERERERERERDIKGYFRLWIGLDWHTEWYVGLLQMPWCWIIRGCNLFCCSFLVLLGSIYIHTYNTVYSNTLDLTSSLAYQPLIVTVSLFDIENSFW